MWLIRVLAIASIVAIVLALVGVGQSKQLQPAEINQGQGHTFTVSIAPENPLLRVYDRVTWSAARLSEDGATLGPWRSSRDRVGEMGGGRYCQQGDVLYFSSSDNSDPRSNGRSYRVNHRVHVRIWFAAALTALTLGILFAGVWRKGTGSRWAAAKARLQTLVFGLPSRTVAAGAIAAALLLILGAFLSSAELAAGILDRLKELSRVLGVLGLSVAAGAVIARASSSGEARTWPAVLQSLVLLLLAMGVQQKLLSTMQIAGFLVGFAGYRWALARPYWRKASQAKIADWTADEGRGLEERLRRVLLFALGLGLIQILPDVVLYWDQSGWADSQNYDRMAHSIATGTEPFGSSRYMPVYQYGMAAFYWAFGHHYFVQQIFNVALVLLMIVFVMAAAWILFRRPAVLLLAGLFAALWEPLHHATWYTQIETWYVPIFAGSVLALMRYLDRRDLGALIVLALAAALVFNTRLQGAFYAAALGLSVLFVMGLSWKSRLQHLVVFGLIFAAVGVLPWASRNYVAEGRFSPSSSQSTSYLAIYNDPRVPLYGIRYSEAEEVRREWNERYSDSDERRAAQQRYFYDRLVNHPDYFVRAAPWRLMAFYGLLPKGSLEPDGPRAMDWAKEGRSYLQSRARFWVPIVISLLGWIATIGSRFNLLFAGLIFANVMVAFTVGFAEPRLCYPVLILHFLMGCAVFAPYAVQNPRSKPAMVIVNWRPLLIAAGVFVLLVMPLAHLTIGADRLYRPIQANAWLRSDAVSIDPELPVLQTGGDGLVVAGQKVNSLEVGKRYSAQIRVTNNMHPPKYICCRSEHDRRLQRDDSIQYFLGYVSAVGGSDVALALRFSGAEVVAPIREGSLIDAVIRIDPGPESGDYPADYWAQVEKAVVIAQPGF